MGKCFKVLREETHQDIANRFKDSTSRSDALPWYVYVCIGIKLRKNVIAKNILEYEMMEYCVAVIQ
jgi:hypothetical protein